MKWSNFDLGKHLDFLSLYIRAMALAAAETWRLARQRIYGPAKRNAWQIASDQVRREDREALREDMPPGWVWRAYFRDELSGEALGKMQAIAAAYPELARAIGRCGEPE